MCVGVCECVPDRKPHLLSFSYLFLFGAATTTIIIAAASAAAATHYDATAAAASVGGFVWLRFYLLSRQLIDWLLYSTWLLNDLWPPTLSVSVSLFFSISSPAVWMEELRSSFS